MSISSRITSMEEHIGNAYVGLKNLGIDTDNIDKNINNISSALETVYNNSPKTEYQEGTEITISGARKGKLELQKKGNLEQETTTGKNILQNSMISQVYGGITFTVNADKTVSASGTSTQVMYRTIKEFILPAGTYILNGCPNGGGSSTYRLFAYNVTTSSNIGTDNGQGLTFTVNGTDTIRFQIIIFSGVTVNNLVFKPMVRLSSITDDTYEKYTGGIPSPNPSYEQPISVVTGNNTVVKEGKNKYDISTNDFLYKCTLSNGLFTSNLEGIRSVNFGYNADNNYTIKNGETYYLSADIRLISGSAINIGSFRFNKEGLTTSAITNPTLTSSFQRYYFSTTNNSGADITSGKFLLQLASSGFSNGEIEFKNVMISKLSGDTYEPYHTLITKQLSLGDIELAKIGTYEDVLFKNNPNNPYYNSSLTEGKWYKRNGVIKLVLNGSENWSYYNNRFWFVINSVDGTYTVNAVCNKYIEAENQQKHSSTPYSFFIGNTGWGENSARVSFHNPDITNIQDWKNDLANNNLIVYYEATDKLPKTDYTEILNTTLIQQLEDIDNMQSYDGTTIITSTCENGNAQLIFKGRGLLAG